MPTLGTMGLALASVACAVTAMGALEARQAPGAGTAFDVVSIRHNTSTDLNSRFVWLPDGSLRVVNVPVRTVVARAFPDHVNVPIAGMPAWAGEERYDIEAKAPAGATGADRQVSMLRSLLAERFKLAFHVEPREHDIYELIVVRTDGRLGPGLKPTGEVVDCVERTAAERAAAEAAAAAGRAPARPDFSGTPPPCQIFTRGAQIEGMVEMSGLASFLTGTAARPVIDRTGLRGIHHVVMEYDRLAAIRGPANAASPDAPPSVFTAVQEQLGLKLQPARAPFETLVIDNLEMPTDN